MTHPQSRLAIARRSSLEDDFRAIRAQTEALCAPLETEDYVVSSMPDVSPTKWHLAHLPGYVSPNPRFSFLFNSYYVQAGERHCRAQRGLVTRPTVDEVFAYRSHVDEHMCSLLERVGNDDVHPAIPIITLGLQHEQQHQELMLTDIKHVFWTNPLRPAYSLRLRSTPAESPPLAWQTTPEGIYQIGHSSAGFAFDNEGPAHRTFVDEFRLASRLVTNREFLAFIDAGGYRHPGLWLSNGWAVLTERRWTSPLYWERVDGEWHEFSLAGMHPLDLNAPVCHVSYFEADAFARWAGDRLPTEAEWEIAAASNPVDGNFVERRLYHPAQAEPLADRTLTQLYGDAWQWTQSPYVAYPGYVPAPGAIGEYNGKWMCDQWVLRGASCATPRSHARRTYRNFFPSDARWQFSGIRLAATR